MIWWVCACSKISGMFFSHDIQHHYQQRFANERSSMKSNEVLFAVSVIWSRLSTITSIIGNPAESSNNHRMSNAGNNDETHSPLHKLFTSRPLFHCTARLWCSHCHCARQTGPTHFLSNQRQGGTLINFFGRQGWRS